MLLVYFTRNYNQSTQTLKNPNLFSTTMSNQQDQIMTLLLEQEDVSWKTILQELVDKEQMDPWDIDITLLTQKYIELVRKMQENNLRISGKVLLAAAFLLKIKSTHLVEHDISQLDLLISQTEDSLGSEENLNEVGSIREKQHFKLIPRNPQARNRKVSINDLIDALQKAMATKKRILDRQRPVKFILPDRKIDIMEVIKDIYHKIVYYTEKDQMDKLSFTQLLPPRAGKMEKVFTFVPLLHLENEDKITTEQEKPFDEIYVKILNKNKTA